MTTAHPIADAAPFVSALLVLLVTELVQWTVVDEVIKYVQGKLPRRRDC